MFDFGDYNAGDLLWLGDWSPTWVAILAILGVVVIGISAYDLRNLAAHRRWTLVGLRGIVYAVAVMLLLEPAIDLKHISKVKNDVAVLVDTSRSMGLKAGEDADETRFDRASAALDEMKPLFERTKEDHNFHFYAFGDDVRPSSRNALAGARPNEDASDLTGAIEKMREELDVENLGGVVVVSDGIDTGAIGRRIKRGEDVDEATLDLLEELDSPVNTLAAASEEGLRDVAVARVLHDDFAFVHNKVSIDVDLQVVGMEATTFPVQLRREGELLQTRQVSITPDKTDYKVSFELVPERIGKEIYTVSVPEFSGEVLTENNISHFLLNVIRDKIRVLQVVGRPSWDERFLRRHLKKNPNYDLISFFILRTDQNVQLVPNDELSLIPFPTRELFEEELGSFDLVIFQNFNFGPYNMRHYLSRIAGFVKDGGGFIMTGGELSFASGGYARTPIEDILPVYLPPVGQSDSVIDLEHFRPNLTKAGLHHPITQLAFDPQSNVKIWSELPKMRGTNIVTGAKPDATVLATHPNLTFNGKPMPVVAVSEKGDGRVMSLTSDSTWRWAFENVGSGGTNREYQVFWNSAIRWLIKDPELKLIDVEVPEDVHAPGEPLDVTVRISNPDYTPAKNTKGVLKVLRRPLSEPRAEELPAQELVETIEFHTDHSGEAAVSVPVSQTGVYELVAQASTKAGELNDRDIFLSVPDVNEFRQIIPRDKLLASLAEASGGHHAVLPDFEASSLRFEPPSYVKVNRRKVIQLWDSFVLFFVILGLLGTEWTLRRHWGRM
ncbi:hypothetical protein FIV42_02885 [Persicimonas caeni]|uniref:Putative glutamine amidotransferase domain-containing protein n=1 Tax=Persicimonas caeni TaxID=2292766 RepID=A0A4Y6PN45_PERCE|nr:glutamine amidotransferase [Persicimonas caeni]QDG49721.1 hypothetical protein FIV42_02885 [Persicimonas caeni]QED30942.1 hypothetical protein FRD00_02880 [Persicimonas caeni]